jgi:DNA-binding transcriptional ArsR family regulator
VYTYHVGNLRADQVAFGYSPAMEATLSLQVLVDAKHHPLHIPWVVQARKQMTPALKAEVEAFSVLYRRPLAAFWPAHTEPGRSFADDLAHLERLPVAEFAAEVLRVTLAEPVTWAEVERNPALKLRAMAATSARVPGSLGMMEEFLADPERSRRRFARFLAAYWEAVLAREWPRLEERFLAEVTRCGRLLRRGGPLAVLERLTPDLTVDRKAGLARLHKSKPAEIRFEPEEPLYLVPSAFVWPLVITRVTAPKLICYGFPDLAEEGQAPMPPEQLLKVLRAAGDTTRLQILQLLGQQPRSTRELAGLIGITEAAVSKHLKLLQDAGLVVPERQSYYVFYRLRPEPLATLSRGLQEAILGPGRGILG